MIRTSDFIWRHLWAYSRSEKPMPVERHRPLIIKAIPFCNVYLNDQHVLFLIISPGWNRSHRSDFTDNFQHLSRSLQKRYKKTSKFSNLPSLQQWLILALVHAIVLRGCWNRPLVLFETFTMEFQSPKRRTQYLLLHISLFVVQKTGQIFIFDRFCWLVEGWRGGLTAKGLP